MKDDTTKASGHFSRGVVASVALHGLLAAVLFLHLPSDISKPLEETVSVEIVPPPPDEKPAEKPPAEAAVPVPAARPPMPPAEAPPPTSADVAKAKPPATPKPVPQAFESGGATDEEPAAAPEGASPPPAEESASLPETKPVAADADMAGPKASGLARDVVPPKADMAAKAVTEGPESEMPQEKPVPAKREAAPSMRDDLKNKTAAKSKAEPDNLKKAKGLYSKKMLADPRVKEALGQLPPNRRIVQLCSIEALEQVRHARANTFPDLLVPFGRSSGLIQDNVLSASGGAFRAQNNWFNIDFRCEVDADTTRIVGFRFAIGGAVPKSEWSRRRLLVDDGAGLAKTQHAPASRIQP